MIVDPNATRWSNGTYEAIHTNAIIFVNLSTLWLIRFTERISCSLSSLNALWATKIGLGGYVVNRGGGGLHVKKCPDLRESV